MTRTRSQRRPQSKALRTAQRAFKHRRQFVARDEAQQAEREAASRTEKRD